MNTNFDFESVVNSTPLTKTLYEEAIDAEAKHLGALEDKNYIAESFWNGYSWSHILALVKAVMYLDLIPNRIQTTPFCTALSEYITTQALLRGRGPLRMCSE